MAFDAQYLFRITPPAAGVAIKQLIMNSHLVVGVGNIYASEALFRARLRPTRRAASLTRTEAARLVRAVRTGSAASRSAPAARRCATIVGADGAPGYFRQRLYVYERKGKACRRCGSTVRALTQGQRSTYYCPGCQK